MTSYFSFVLLPRVAAVAEMIWQLWQPFRFAERSAVKREERERFLHEQHIEQLDMILSRNEKQSTAQLEAVIELAKAQQAQATAMQSWMELFKQDQGPGATHTIRPIDEVDDAHQREKVRLREKGFPIDGPHESQLEWLMTHPEI